MANGQKRALITGVTGQDGMYLAELLVDKGYEVYGLIRGQHNPKRAIVEAEIPAVKLIDGDLTDLGSLVRAIEVSKPDEIYNLAAISFVAYSFDQPNITADVTGQGVLNMLEAIRITGIGKTARFYQASTSEMFGGLDYNRPDDGYNEESLFHPRSPYGVAKLYGHWITKNYRESYGIHASSGILFNHESPRRGLEFVTRKVTNAVARIKLGVQKELLMGNLDPKRDWGYAGDYVEGMWRMLQQDEPGDYVLATGKLHTIHDLLDLSFNAVGIDDWKPYVKQDPRFMRPAEVDLLLGDPLKAKEKLGWEPKVSFEEMIKMMVENDLKIESEKAKTPQLHL
jgi:GDPmannose 4,6-dehydratase